VFEASISLQLPSKLVQVAITKLSEALADTSTMRARDVSSLALLLLKRPEVDMGLAEGVGTYAGFWAHELPAEALMNVLR